MKTVDAAVTSQGQVTIPVEVRRHLGLSKRDRVTFVIDDEGVRIVPARFTLESAFGSIPALPGVSVDFDDEIEEAMADEADRAVRPSQG